MPNLSKHKWENLNINYIIGGKTPDGVALLKLFLTDYQNLFSTKVNPSCSKCLQNYLSNYKNKIYTMENPNTSNYRLKPKYNNIALRAFGEGYNVNINNNNITDETALILLERFPAEKIFEKFPIQEIQEEKEITEATAEKVVKIRKRRK